MPWISAAKAIPLMLDLHTQPLEQIRRTHERIAVIVGIFMAAAMSLYFFTFSDLIDKGASLLLWLELVTTILFVFGLIFLKRLAFFITRLMLGKNSACREAMKGMTVADLEKLPRSV